MKMILVQQRRYHEVKERLMDSTLRDQINSDHRTGAMQDRYVEVSGNLRDLHDDKDGLGKEELNAISGRNEFAEFYNKLKQIKESHRKHPNEICVPMSVEFEELLKARENPSEEAQNLVEFTDEEGYGRYLDLHDCYLQYINLKALEKPDYITYLSIFDQLFDIFKERKMLTIRETWRYFKPLQDQKEPFGKIQNEFEKKWENGTFPGWPKETSSELASLGLDRLKSALLALGLKLFSTKGKSLESLGTSRDTERNKDVAFLEARIYECQVRTGEEREEEEEEQISESETPQCEICGNYTPRGPKAFQLHFAEWRHAHGMRCLGTPNTAPLANVRNAVSSWAEPKLQKASERRQPDTEEDSEDSSGGIPGWRSDSSGNVVNKKPYEDLKGQGLL
ncbi:unnamed protein product [Nyctereutes procyonoides]|uniref:(raccoon dog) hypothetical protein n=1 Tax=Nyctereutes procyonoides TaxID=34880 RepID=A0A812A0B7_NYCPR|nr:unnamed protein product [Nyctereutes procyonoides]